MSSLHVPAELQDHIVDLLHDARDALKSCCLVSKSWIPRTRKHLFADIAFRTPENVRSWKTMFPDPSISPACYTRSLFIRYPENITTTDAEEEDGWIRTFSHVEHFAVEINGAGGNYECLVPFHGFSPATKSLLVDFFDFPPSPIFNLVLSFPLLEDLSVTTCDHFSTTEGINSNPQPAEIQSSSPPVFTGSLKLSVGCSIDSVASRLLSLPNGLRFRKLDIILEDEDEISFTGKLVGMCCATLESLLINSSSMVEPFSGLIDLSKATKLKDMIFACAMYPGWVTLTLRTITCDHSNLQRLTIDASVILDHSNSASPPDPVYFLGETSYGEWLELDGLLAQLWESHPICLGVLYDSFGWIDESIARGWMMCLLPKVMGTGRAKLITSKEA